MSNLKMGEKIRNRRIELGMTQIELALKVGLSSDTTICKVEADERGIPLKKLQRYADALNVSINYLIGDNKAYETLMNTPEKYEKDTGVRDDIASSLRGIFSVLTNSERKLVLEYAQRLYGERTNAKKD